MIVTVTANPALDKTARVDVMRANALNRLESVVIDCGGKGVNVSATIHALGGDSVAAGFAGGGTGEELLARIAAKGLRSDFIRIKNPTRTNLKVVDREGRLTELNEPGPEVSIEEWRSLETCLFHYAERDAVFVISGSLCRGLESAAYRNLCGALRSKKAKVFLDADGEALKLALEAEPAMVPDYIKPNRYEMLTFFGINDDETVTEEALLNLAEKLLERGLTLCAISMGVEGALFVNSEGAWRAPGMKVPIRSTVGAGDSMVGALVYGLEQGLDAEAYFALSVAASAGACTTAGTNPPERKLVDDLIARVRLEKIR
ncbi:MAG: 1-phosphofructokinase family hexose kinase [Treponema sp.]|jgi:1-phosphofructokinase|nr:1-phosphofructokinase family hexose kinase [Treponema sp.]